jgi:hypothetical protein
MPHFPLYCETGHPWLFIAEPVNFATNAFILIAAAFAARLVWRAPGRGDAGLWLLVGLLAATGVGSFLWHGWRTAFNLMLDTYCGLAFLVALVGLWAGRLGGRWAGAGAVLGLIGAGAISLTLAFLLMRQTPAAWRALMFAPFFLTVVGFGVAFSIATRRRSSLAARFGGWAIASGLAAAVARSADLPLCPWMTSGTHFLWHTFLSLAAFLSIAMMLRLKPVRQ